MESSSAILGGEHRSKTSPPPIRGKIDTLRVTRKAKQANNNGRSEEDNKRQLAKRKAASFSALAEGYPGQALKRLDAKPLLFPSEAYRGLIALHPEEDPPDLLVAEASPDIVLSKELCEKYSQARPDDFSTRTEWTSSCPLTDVYISIVWFKKFGQGVVKNRKRQKPRLASRCPLDRNFQSKRWSPANCDKRDSKNRLSVSALNKTFLKSDQNYLTNQLAVLYDGVLLGAYVIKDRLNSNDSLVMFDTNNAFYSLLRKKLLNTVGNTMLSKYTEWAYRRHSNLYVGEGLVILWQKGV